MKPRVLFVSRERHRLPLEGAQQRKWDALSELLDVRVLAAARQAQPQRDSRFALVPPQRPFDGARFYALLPWRIWRQLRQFAPDAVLAQGVHETVATLIARRFVARRPAVVLDLHGDWRAATRLYGSVFRRFLSPASDAAGRLAVRRAQAVRTVTGYTSELVRATGRQPAAEFPAFMDGQPFLTRPPAVLPTVPTALFVGVLERYKNVDGLAAAWRRVARELPEARLHVVGEGSLDGVVEQLAFDLPLGVRWTRRLDPEGVATALDEASFLVLPSRSEGMGRVLIEAFARGRPVVASRVGGIVDVVEDGITGLLVDLHDPRALTRALIRLLGDRQLVEQLGANAHGRSASWFVTPQEYASRVAALIAQATA